MVFTDQSQEVFNGFNFWRGIVAMPFHVSFLPNDYSRIMFYECRVLPLFQGVALL